MAPMFFGSIAVIAADHGRGPLKPFFLVSILLSSVITTGEMLDLLDSSHETVYYISRDLAQLHGKMLTTESGRLAYYSHWVVHDSWGLNTPPYAHQLIDEGQLESNAYDLIVAHCGLDPRLQESSNPGYLVRTWDNQCHVLMGYIQSKHYETFIVPFYQRPPHKEQIQQFFRGRIKGLLGMKDNWAGCNRYDVFAISPAYQDKERLRGILASYGALPYLATGNRFRGDRLCSGEGS